MRVDEAGTAAGESLSPPPPVGTERSRDNLVQPIRAWPPPPDLATGCDAILGWVRASGEASLPSSCHCIVGIDRYLEPVASNETPVVLRRRLADLFRDLHDATPEAGVHLTVGPFEGQVIRALFGLLRSLERPRPSLAMGVGTGTSDGLAREAVRTAIATGQPSFISAIGYALSGQPMGEADACGVPHGGWTDRSEAIDLHSPTILRDIRDLAVRETVSTEPTVTVITVDDTARRNPAGVADLVRGAISEGLAAIALAPISGRSRAPGSVHAPAPWNQSVPAPSRTAQPGGRHQRRQPMSHEHTARPHP